MTILWTYWGFGSLFFSLNSVISADIWASLGPRNVPRRLQKSPDIGDPPPSTREREGRTEGGMEGGREGQEGEGERCTCAPLQENKVTHPQRRSTLWHFPPASKKSTVHTLLHHQEIHRRHLLQSRHRACSWCVAHQRWCRPRGKAMSSRWSHPLLRCSCWPSERWRRRWGSLSYQTTVMRVDQSETCIHTYMCMYMYKELGKSISWWFHFKNITKKCWQICWLLSTDLT